MKMRTEAEIEEAIAMHQMLGLCIGIVVVMIVAWLTLPSDEEQIVNRACFQQCKEVISKLLPNQDFNVNCLVLH